MLDWHTDVYKHVVTTLIREDANECFPAIGV